MTLKAGLSGVVTRSGRKTGQQIEHARKTSTVKAQSTPAVDSEAGPSGVVTRSGNSTGQQIEHGGKGKGKRIATAENKTSSISAGTKELQCSKRRSDIHPFFLPPPEKKRNKEGMTMITIIPPANIPPGVQNMCNCVVCEFIRDNESPFHLRELLFVAKRSGGVFVKSYLLNIFSRLFSVMAKIFSMSFLAIQPESKIPRLDIDFLKRLFGKQFTSKLMMLN